jgi:hypothetical protein
MKKTPCSKMFTLVEFEQELIKRRVKFNLLLLLQPQISHWWSETNDMTLEELCDDFIEHFELSVVSLSSNS